MSSGHGARDVSHVKVSELYANITRELVTIYVDLCETCKVRKSLMVKPIVSNTLNSRCQVDFIDMQSDPDGDNKFILKIICQHLSYYDRGPQNDLRRCDTTFWTFCVSSEHLTYFNLIMDGNLPGKLRKKLSACDLVASWFTASPVIPNLRDLWNVPTRMWKTYLLVG